MLRLIFIGNGNWDLHIDTHGKVWSIAKESKRAHGCQNSYFGDKRHLMKLLSDGVDLGRPTDAGLAFIEGMNCDLHIKGYVRAA